jgi:hypothetical protein
MAKDQQTQGSSRAYARKLSRNGSAAMLLAGSLRMPKAVSSRTANEVRLTTTEDDEMCTHTPRRPGG